VQAETTIPEVGGMVTGVSPSEVVCENRATGQKVIIQDGARSWSCEDAGLVINPGDEIWQTIKGQAP
jgi:hypothetical protein